MDDLFSTHVVLRVTGVSANQLKYWGKIGLVSPQKSVKKYYYTFREVIKIKVVSNLKSKGLSLQKIRKGINNLARVLPSDDEPLSRLIIHTDGQDMIAVEKGMYYSATSMQRYFQFDMEELQTTIIKFQSGNALKGKDHSPQIGSANSASK